MRSLLGRFHRPNARSQSEQLFMLNNLGDGSTLSLDFTTGVLDPRLTFSRAGGGTYVGPDGYIYGIDSATSSSLAIGTGSKSVTLTATAGVNRRFEVGQTVYFSNGANNMSGLVTAYSPSTQVITINATSSSGSGSFTSWFVGNASARFDYDPTTLTPRGLLIEGSANNLLNWSESFETTGGAVNWNFAAVNTTRGTVTTTNPTGSSATVIKIQETNANGLHAALAVPGSSASTAYTFSVWAKAVERTFLQLLENGGSGANNMVNLSNGNIVSESSSGITTVTALGTTGWYRIAMRLTTIAGQTSANCQFRLSTDGTTTSYTGTTGNGIYIWGAQLEAGSGASSYIPTGASTGSRAYDHCYATGANFTSWFSVGAGTMVVVSDNIKNNTQNLAATISDDSTNNYVRMGFKVGGASNEYLLTAVGGPSSFQGAADSGYAPSLNTVYRMAYAWDTNNFGIVANGGTVATDTSGTIAGAGVLNRLVVGGDFVAIPNDIYFKNGHIKTLKYWPTRLPNAQLQALTT